MNKKLVSKILGILLICEAISLLIPFAISVYTKSGDGTSFAITIVLCLSFAVPFLSTNLGQERLQIRDGYAAVALGWIVLSLFGAIPYYVSGCCSYIDALFETVSGFTTTGATIFPSPSSLPRGIQFWRAMTHWMGGMGVLVLLLALLPKFSEGSANLMKAESPGPIAAKLLPRTNDTAKALYTIYICMTTAQTLCLRLAGLPWFDAITVSMSTISTGGFSHHDIGIAHYGSEIVNWIIVFFMLLSSINFALLFLLIVRRRTKDVFKSEELRSFLAIVSTTIVLVALILYFQADSGIYQSISQSAFQVASLISTTGFATTDFTLWPATAQALLLLVMLIGGCAGSTAGGIKVSRVVLLFKNLHRDLRRIIHPREVRPIVFESQRVEENTVASSSLFLFTYVVILAFCTVIISLDNVDFATALSSSVAMISNVGPGIGKVGPLYNFSFYSAMSKLVLSLAMLFGRLEIFPLLILLVPGLWTGGKKEKKVTMHL